MRLLLVILMMATSAEAQTAVDAASPLVAIGDLDPTIVVEARYSGDHNFIGRPIRGYEAPKCLLTREAATALVAVHRELRDFGLGLKTYDCFRPQRAVDHFVEWAADLSDQRMKAEFFPEVDKSELFAEGYIADRSGHSRGSTVDLTIVPFPTPAVREDESLPVDCRLPADERRRDDSIEMGTAYDCFDPLSHTASRAVSDEARANRLLLKLVMEKHGFVNYDREWWHYTLADEPFPDRFFDLPVR